MANPLINRGTFLVLRTDGREEIIEKKPTMRMIAAAIGAETLDTVRIGKADGSDLVMVVNDNGYETQQVKLAPNHFKLECVKPLGAFNDKATVLYHSICYPGVTHKIVGDVAIVHDSDFA